MKTYAPLHIHTTYSKLDGASKMKELVHRASELGVPALHISDHGTLSGWIDFYKECKKHDIKSLLGCELYLSDDRLQRENVYIEDQHGEIAGSKHYYHLTSIAADQDGYKNLLKISSDSYLNGMHRKPRTDWSYISEHSKGVTYGTGCLGSPILQALLHDNFNKAMEITSRLKDIAEPGNLFVEVMNHHLPEQRKTNPMLFDIAKRLNLPVAASLDAHYVNKEDASFHDVMLCCGTGSKLSDPKRFKFSNDEFYLKSYDEMLSLFPDNPEVLSNTLLIAEKCNVEIDFNTQHLPIFDVPEGFEDDVDYLRHLVAEGAIKRYGSLTGEVADRLNYELEVIANMGVSSYFLIVWDLIRYAREEGIQTSPGRGSSSGSAVFFCLGVTQIDPLKYDLPFERFLNPSRVTFPDADLDWGQGDRQKIVDYTTAKYGADYVANIATFGRIKARTAIRDTVRVMGLEYSVGDRLSKMLPEPVSGVDTPLYACLEEHPKYQAGYENAQSIRDLYNSDPETKTILDTALKLEGQIRQSGIHAAGIIISDTPITDVAPLEKRKDGPAYTQWDKKMVESIGLVKMDYLGLINLDIIGETCRAVGITTDDIPNDDPETYRLLQAGETLGVFQLDSKGMRNLLKNLRPDSLKDISAVLALYRPGPMAQNWHNEYADVKNGRRTNEPFHPDAAEALKDTYNIPLYQESLMKLSQIFAGYSVAEADNLRKIIGRKEVDAMTAEREKFVTGCVQNGYEPKLSSELFDKIEGFSAYGFSQNHAFPYALVSYWTAYLKAHYPREFMAATCSAAADSPGKDTIYINEVRRMGLTMDPPDINTSQVDYTVTPTGVRMGLRNVREVGALAGRIIEGAPYKSLYDFAKRVNPNVAAFKNLAAAGALDSFGTRLGISSVASEILKSARKDTKKNPVEQQSMFDAADLVEIEVPVFEDNLPVKLANEKYVTGAYISGHPLDSYEKFKTENVLDDLLEADVGGKAPFLCLVTSLVVKHTRKEGKAMAIIEVEDQSGGLELVCFPHAWSSLKQSIKVGDIVVADIKIGSRDSERSYALENAKPIQLDTEDVAPGQFFGVYVPESFRGPQNVSKLKGVLLSHSGNVPVRVYVSRSTTMNFDHEFKVTPSQALHDALSGLFGGVS